MNDRDLFKQALEALELYQSKMSVQMFDDTAKALRERLAQPEQESVVWQHRKPIIDSQGNTRGYYDWLPGKGLERWPHRRLYTSPPEQHKPLTDKRITQVIDSMPNKFAGFMIDWDLYEFARAIEAAHGIGEKK